jgi:hypothetical protein
VRVAAVKFFDDAAHYAPPSQCPQGLQVPRAAFWQLYKVADCFHTMVLPEEATRTAVRRQRAAKAAVAAAAAAAAAASAAARVASDADASAANASAASDATFSAAVGAAAAASASSVPPPFKYKWLVRARWDLGYVSPLPPLSRMATTHVYVPYNYWYVVVY